MSRARRRKKKTGTQIVLDFTDNITVKIKNISQRNWLPMQQICIACIIIFSCSIIFGAIGYFSRINDIHKRERNIERLKNELHSMEALIMEKQIFKERLINDSLAIEEVARSYGLSKKGEKVFYFVD